MNIQNKLNIAVYQMNSRWKAIEENLDHLNALVLDTEIDLLVLPEMFATGFCMDAEEISADAESILDGMQSYSQDKGIALTASVAIKENSQYYNRLLFYDRGECLATYDKRHLFSYSGEDKIYTKGQESIVFEWKGWKICPQICYDLRFPVWFRNTSQYDLLLNVANWPVQRIEIWTQLLKARAIENMSYVLACNRTGIDGNSLQYNGQSGLYFPSMEELTVKEQENWLFMQLDYKKLHDYREKYPFLDDRDSFTLHK